MGSAPRGSGAALVPFEGIFDAATTPAGGAVEVRDGVALGEV